MTKYKYDYSRLKMEQVINALNGALSFAYDNILSIAMMILLIATGIFLTVKTGFFQFRRFGYVIKNTLGKLFHKNMHKQDKGSVSPFQAVTTALAGTIGTGNATQSNSISGVLDLNFNIAPWITGLVLTAIVAVVIIGGVKRIATVNEKLVPVMAIFFILSSIINISKRKYFVTKWTFFYN